MSEECSHNCESCSQNCSERKNTSMRIAPHRDAKIKKVIGVVSGKGGVGKSMVTSLLASSAKKAGKSVGILDADITGPSIPKAFGVHEIAKVTDDAVYPVPSSQGIKLMSINLLLEEETDPVIWRGPVIANTVTQFWTEVAWGELDYLFVDMPPGTGDVPLTVFQSLPLDGIVVVTTPQDLVSMIVEKAVNMAKEMKIPIIGLVENMSYFLCPDCQKKHWIFGESQLDEIAKANGIPFTLQLPLDSQKAKLCDSGKVEEIELGAVQELFAQIDSVKQSV